MGVWSGAMQGCSGAMQVQRCNGSSGAAIGAVLPENATRKFTKTVIAETSAKRFAPGWAPGRRIDKICEKIITGTSAKELAWANAKGLYGWG